MDGFISYLAQNRKGFEISGVKMQNVFAVTLECIDETCE